MDRSRGRPKKAKSFEDEIFEYQRDQGVATMEVKQLARAIAKAPGSVGFNVLEVDALLNEWFAKGFTLFAAFVIDNSTTDVVVFYILTKQ